MSYRASEIHLLLTTGLSAQAGQLPGKDPNTVSGFSPLAPTSNTLTSAPKGPIRIVAQPSTYSDFSVFKPVLSFTKFRQLPKSLPNGPSRHSTNLMGIEGSRRENAKHKGGACLGLEAGSATCCVCMVKLLNLSVLWFPHMLYCK